MMKRIVFVVLGVMMLSLQPAGAKNGSSTEASKPAAEKVKNAGKGGPQSTTPTAGAAEEGKKKSGRHNKEVIDDANFKISQQPELTKEEIEWAIREYNRLGRNPLKGLSREQIGAIKRKEREAQTALVTKGGFVDYTLGKGAEGGATIRAIGATGIIGTLPLPKEDPRSQILVIGAMEDSPARGKGVGLMDGVLREHDVILGVLSPKVPGLTADGNFTTEAHKAMATAITLAEQKENGGKLVLKIWRPKTEYWVTPSPKGKNVKKILRIAEPLVATTQTVELKLRVMGSFSPTSPWNCEKTEKMIELAAESIAREGFKKGEVSAEEKGEEEEEVKKKVAVEDDGAQEDVAPGAGEGGDPEGQADLEDDGGLFKTSVENYLDAIGLLATGDKKYHPMLREYAHSMLEKGKTEDIMKGSPGTWGSAYRLLFLTEYYLATEDKEILPAIEGFARCMGMGVSGVGSWSHSLAYVKGNGLYGPPSAYGDMNQVSEVAAMSLVLAQKCGIKDKYVDKAVSLALDLYPYYVDKGAIPYGDHGPALERRHDINGRNSIAAVLYDIAGRKREADYFTRMTIMSHSKREGGHTGHFFAWQWGAAGAARGGPEAASAFCESTRYFTELGRRYDGSSRYQPMMGGDTLKTGNWSTRGAQLVQYCLPRKALYITGKGGSVVTPVVGDELKMLLDAGKFDAEKATDAELLKALSHYSPILRNDAVEEIDKRDMKIVPQLLEMLKSDNRFARYGSLQALRYVGHQNQEAIGLCLNILENDSDWTARFFACNAVDAPRSKSGRHTTDEQRAKPLGLPDRSHTKRLMQMIIKPYPEAGYEAVKHKGQLAKLLLEGVYGLKDSAADISQLDRELLVPMMNVLLVHPHGTTRTIASQLLPRLSKEELEPLWGVLYYAMTHKAPSGVMFGDGVNVNGNAVMAKNHIKEGLPVVIKYVFDTQGWGNFKRKKNIPDIVDYGQYLVPHLDKIQGKFLDNKNIPEAIEKIKATPKPELVSIEKQIKEYEAKKAAEGK